MRKLSMSSSVVTISEHVDYWNYLGWNDPYSSKSWTSRQQSYVRSLGLSGLVTPQFVIDGCFHVSGSSENVINRLVSKAAKQNPKIPLKVSCSLDKVSGEIRVDVSCPKKLQKNLFLHTFLVEENLSSRVIAGENRGSFLRHVSVARAIDSKRLRTGLNKKVVFFISRNWNLKNIRVIAFIQEMPGKNVIALGSTNLL